MVVAVGLNIKDSSINLGVNMAATGNSCETPGCDKEAKLQCPTCIKLDIKVTFLPGPAILLCLLFIYNVSSFPSV